MPDTKTLNKLLPCPFCGTVPAGTIEIDVAMWAVACGACQSIGPVARDEGSAVASWNRRQPGEQPVFRPQDHRPAGLPPYGL